MPSFTALTFVLVFETVRITDAFLGGGLFGGLGGGGGQWGGGGGHHGYGYGSDICAGARQRQENPQMLSSQYPSYGGFNNYQRSPTTEMGQSNYPGTSYVDYRTNLPKPKTTCSYPTSRDATIFDQTCFFPTETSQVSCSSRGASLPSGTTSLLTCKSPQYYSDGGEILLEVCKDGKWYGDSKTLTCKLKLVTTTSPPVHYQQPPARDYVVSYVQKPTPLAEQYQNSYNMVVNQAPKVVEPEPNMTYWYQIPAASLSQTPTVVYYTTSTTTAPTTTTTIRPYYMPENIDWRLNYGELSSPYYQNGSGKCPPLLAKSKSILECLSKSSRPSNGGSGYILAISDCQEPQAPGTEATYKCQTYHEPMAGMTTQYRKCKENGEWTGSDDGFLCSLECGKSNPIGRLPLITWGEITIQGQWPWHAALFIRDRELMSNACGGTLISQRAVLTAAHCVNLYYSSLLRDLNDVRVDLGRYYRESDDDSYVQNFKVEKIVSHPAYNPWIYESDIAIIILKGTAQIGYHVRPICFPKSQNAAFDELQLADGTYATVVGWGTDENGEKPDELKSAKLKVIGYRECILSFENSDTGALLAKSTTFCAGNYNKTNVCSGDSGSGAYFGIKTASGETRWHLQGLVSVGINTKEGGRKCDPEKVAIFTRISPYSDWIVRVLSENDAL